MQAFSDTAKNEFASKDYSGLSLEEQDFSGQKLNAGLTSYADDAARAMTVVAAESVTVSRK